MERYKAVALVGDAVYNGFWFPKEEIEKAYKTMIGRTFVIDHSYDIIGVVGFVEESLYESPAMINIFTIDEELEASSIALKWIAKKEERGEMPEVSVSFSAKIADEWYDDETPTLVDIEFIHLALVTAGACSPEDGCGIVEESMGDWYEPMEYRRIGDYNYSMGKYRMSEPDETTGRVVMEIRFGMRLEKVEGETMSEEELEDNPEDEKPLELRLSVDEEAMKDAVKIKLGDCVSIVTQLEAVNVKLLEANETLRKRYEEIAGELETLQMAAFAEEIAESEEELITKPKEVEKPPVVQMSEHEVYDRVTELLEAGGRKRKKTLRSED